MGKTGTVPLYLPVLDFYHDHLVHRKSGHCRTNRDVAKANIYYAGDFALEGRNLTVSFLAGR